MNKKSEDYVYVEKKRKGTSMYIHGQNNENIFGYIKVTDGMSFENRFPKMWNNIQDVSG